MTTFTDNSNTTSANNGVTDAKLVREVEKHPALYNPKRRGYKDATEMDRSWLQIANELGMKRKSPSLLLKYSALTLWQHKTEGWKVLIQTPRMNGHDPEPALVTWDSHIRTSQHPSSYNAHLLRGLPNACLHTKLCIIPYLLLHYFNNTK
jgi:hypothetical protein